MRMLISGSGGLIGRRLCEELAAHGDSVVRLVRKGGPERPGESVTWDPETGQVEISRLEGFDAIVHLAGESIAGGRWTAAKKKRIRDSRIIGTQKLAGHIGRLSRPPKVVVTASAIGIYGDRGDEELDESATPGKGFLAEVCRDWEKAARPASDCGARLVHLRTGIVLAGDGGALAKMKLPFSLGLGGRLGSGRQYMSWISLDDIVGAIRHVIASPSLEGPVNGVGPSPVANEEFTRVLGGVLHRPTVLPAPAPALRLVLGEMADALLLASQRVVARRLADSGYRYRHPTLESALRAALRK